MNSSKTTVILAAILFLSVAAFHFKIAAPEKDPGEPVLHTFRESAKGPAADKGFSSVRSDPPGQKISINEAALQDIMQVSGFGEKLGRKVIEKRDELGGKLTEEDILAIGGIGESRLASLKEKFIILSSGKENKKVISLTGLKEDHSVCPNCKKEMDLHNRRKHEKYIYCPHCLSYLPEKIKNKER